MILDTAMASAVLVIGPVLAWPVAVVIVLSAGRCGFAPQSLDLTPPDVLVDHPEELAAAFS